MEMETFQLERQQSLWEHQVDINLSESGVDPLTLGGLAELGLDLERLHAVPLEYIQSNGTPELRSQLAGYYADASVDHVLVTNGSSEANYVAVQVLVEPGDEVVAIVPNYLQVGLAARGLGALVRDVPILPGADESSWSLDWEAFEAAVGERTKLIYLSHPNNPTGHVFTPSELGRIAAWAERVGAWVVSDEVYRGAVHDLGPGEEAPGMWGLGERVIAVSSLSKAYGLPGTRLGWMVGPPEFVERCWARRDFTTIAPGALSDAIARFATEPSIQERLFERARRMMRANRQTFRDWTGRQNGRLAYREPRAGAYAFAPFFENGRLADCAGFSERLRRNRSVLLVAGRWAGMPGYLRFGLGLQPAAFAEGLRRVGLEIQASGSSESAQAEGDFRDAGAARRVHGGVGS